MVRFTWGSGIKNSTGAKHFCIFAMNYDPIVFTPLFFHSMKFFFPTLFFIAGLIACKPGAKTETQPVEATPVDLNETIPFAGDWLNEKYYHLIHDTRSPRDAQEKVENCFIQIPSHTRDTTVMIYGFHESGPEIVIVKKNDQYELWEVQGDSLDKKAWTAQVIDADHLQLGEDRFVKINSAHGTYNEPLILEEILFKGQYKLKGGGDVEFKNTGEVTGLGKYKYFRVLSDYLDAGLDVNQVWLGETRDSMDYYGFKSKDKSLDIYRLKCLEYSKEEHRCEQVDFGKLAYALTKQDK